MLEERLFVQVLVGGDEKALCAEFVMHSGVLYAASSHDSAAGEFWPVAMDCDVKAGSPLGGYDLDVRDVRGMMSAALCSRLNVRSYQCFVGTRK